MKKIDFYAIQDILGLNLETFITEELVYSIGGVEFESSDLDIPSDLNQFSFSLIEEVDNINNIKVHKLSKKELLISFSADVGAELDFFVHKANYCSLSDEERQHIFIDYDDWNRHYMACSVSKELSIKIKLIFDIDSKKVTSSEITKFTPKPPTIFTKEFEDSLRYIQRMEEMSLQPTKEFEDSFRHIKQIRDELVELSKKGLFTLNVTDRETDKSFSRPK